MGKALKFRAHIPVGDGRGEHRELSGPSNYHVWRYNYRMLQSLAVGLDALTSGTALRYERFIESLHMVHPECWAFLYVAEDRARHEYSAQVKRRAEAAKKKGEVGRAARLGRVPCRRLCYAASWIRALLSEREGCPLTLERLVRPSSSPSPKSGWSIEFDASVYGGGAVLRDGHGVVVEYFAVVWYGDEAPQLGVVPNDSRHQTFWEFATLLLSLCVWGDRFTEETVAVLGDNTAALTCALSLAFSFSRSSALARMRSRWAR